ncbi:MAG TPA: tRNA-specific adenosine deaminase, partial [Planctomycetes bacterium]|nr:tRNA-specific adenosine deaminase [Planctomycetota bacterium]
ANSANNHFPRVQGGILADESTELLQSFFRERRGREGKKGDPGSPNGACG